MKKGPSQEIIKRIESIEGRGIGDAAKTRYLVEERSFRWLSFHWNVNERTVRRILVHYGVPVRHGGDAVKTQWRDNPGRRRQAGEALAATNHALAQAGKHVRQGKDKSNSPLIRGIADKLRTSSSFLRPETKSKALANSLETRRKHPERMSAIRYPESEAEAAIRHHLAAMELPFEHRRLFGSYIVDFYIPTLNLAIDCQGRNRFPLSYEKNQAILAQCDSVIYCINEFAKRGNFTHLDEYVGNLQRTGGNPSTGSKETVILGACGKRPFGAYTDKFRINLTGMHGNYCSILTAASDN